MLQCFKHTSQSGYGYANVLLVLLILALGALELRLDIFERMGGNFLKWSNTSRPRTGRAWEYQSSSISAMQELGQIVSQQNEIRRDLQTTADFAELPQDLSDGRILAVSREKFLDLYEKFPSLYSGVFGQSSQLLEYTVISGWKRVAFIGRNNGLDVYYLNEDNMVLTRFFLDENYFSGLQRWGAELPGDISVDPDFNGRIFSAAEFVYALSLADPAGESFLPADELLKQSSELVQAGISRRWRQGLVDIAFKLADGRTLVYSIDDSTASKILRYLPDKGINHSGAELFN